MTSSSSSSPPSLSPVIMAGNYRLNHLHHAYDRHLYRHRYRVIVIVLPRYLLSRCRMQGCYNGFVMVRPPGHHAGRQGHTCGAPSCGFCLLNNVCIGTCLCVFPRSHSPRGGTALLFSGRAPSCAIGVLSLFPFYLFVQVRFMQ